MGYCVTRLVVNFCLVDDVSNFVLYFVVLVIDSEFYTYSELMESVDDKVVAMNGMGICGRKEDKMPNSYKKITKELFQF